jgi:hypothetical protein
MVGIVLGLAAVATVLVVAVVRQPSGYRVARTATMAASPAALFPHVVDLRKFNVWNPWIKLDPAAKVTFEGPPAGSGATMAWAGNKNVGEGSMTGRNTLAGKAIGLVMSMDRMIGGQFEKGLADLASLTAATAKESER